MDIIITYRIITILLLYTYTAHYTAASIRAYDHQDRKAVSIRATINNKSCPAVCATEL